MNPARQAIAQLLISFSGQQNTLTIPRPYITLCDGDILAALLLSQCIYWTDRTKDAEGWFAKSYVEWQDELGMTQYQVSRAAKALQPLGLETKLKKFNGAPTVHYRINMDEFSKSIVKFLDNPGLSSLSTIHDQETSQSLTEPTTENTAKPTTAAAGASEIRPNIFKLHEDLTGSVGGKLLADDLQDTAAEFPEDWIEAAYHEAAQNNARSLKYVRSILARWRIEGFQAPRKTTIPTSFKAQTTPVSRPVATAALTSEGAPTLKARGS